MEERFGLLEVSSAMTLIEPIVDRDADLNTRTVLFSRASHNRRWPVGQKWLGRPGARSVGPGAADQSGILNCIAAKPSALQKQRRR